MIDSIRKKVKRFFVRRRFFKLQKVYGSTEQWRWYDFVIIRHALCEFLFKYDTGAIKRRDHGLCFNAGFMGVWRTPVPFEDQARLFQEMMRIFMREVKGQHNVSLVWPFAEVDDIYTADRYAGLPGEIRLECVNWIIDLINDNDLGDGHQIDEW